MITKRHLADSRVLAYELSGKISEEDYRDVLIPDLAEKIDKGPVRVVLHMGEQVEGFSFGALVEDAKLGLNYRDAFEKIALSTDNHLVRAGAHLLQPFVPFEMKLFHDNELREAEKWAMSEETRPIHRLNRAKGILTIHPIGDLEKEQFELLEEHLDEYLREHKKLRGVLIESPHFPGWSNFSAMLAHLRFVKEHRKLVDKVAILTNDKLFSVLPKIAAQFVQAEVKSFKVTEQRLARMWLENTPVH